MASAFSVCKYPPYAVREALEAVSALAAAEATFSAQLCSLGYNPFECKYRRVASLVPLPPSDPVHSSLLPSLSYSQGSHAPPLPFSPPPLFSSSGFHAAAWYQSAPLATAVTAAAMTGVEEEQLGHDQEDEEEEEDEDATEDDDEEMDASEDSSDEEEEEEGEEDAFLLPLAPSAAAQDERVTPVDNEETNEGSAYTSAYYQPYYQASDEKNEPHYY